MDRRRFATRTAALLAAAAIPPLARATPTAPGDDKAAEEKPRKDVKPTGEQKVKQKPPAEEKKKTPEEQKLKNPGEQTGKSGANEEQKAKGSSPAEQKKKEKDQAAEEKKKAAKGTFLDERWQREQDKRLAAAMRRVGKLPG